LQHEAISRLQREVDKLRHYHFEALEEATYVGTTTQEAGINDARRERIRDLVFKNNGALSAGRPANSTLTADELERMESLAKDIQEAPDQRTFIQAVAELKNFLSTRAEKL